MRNFWRTASQSVYMPLVDRAEDTLRSFSASGRALFLFFAGMLVISSGGLLYLLNAHFLVAVPAYGGSFTEGIIGTPRFINPILDISDADRDLTQLVYSGLLRADPKGDYINDLADSYTISPDGRTYTFLLKKNATFHDGSPVTADDVVFTVAKTQDPELKSPQRANWSGVSVQKVDQYTVQFTLKSPYAPFIENLTLGILPKHLWQDITDDEFPFSELNTAPVGSGPFKVTGASRTSSGIPSSYALSAFSHYAPGRPFLNTINFRFYQSEAELAQALKSGDIEAAAGISPATLASMPQLPETHSPLNRVFAVFFNQNQSSVLRNNEVRQALSDSIDRNDLVKKILGGFGTPLTGPIPPSMLPETTSIAAAAPLSTDDRIQAARQALLRSGWSAGPDGHLQKIVGSGKKAQTTTLAFSLATGNVPELRAAAEYLRQTWEKVGAKVDVQIYSQGDLSQNVIRPRKYDALLFGEVIGRELDLFAFWSSSQRVDPGLNVALYTNSTADSILQKLRETSDDSARQKLYTQFNGELQKDNPAVFLYAPDFVYSMPKDIHGLTLGLIETPSDRFLSVSSWHRETDRVWPLFANYF